MDDAEELDVPEELDEPDVPVVDDPPVADDPPADVPPLELDAPDEDDGAGVKGTELRMSSVMRCSTARASWASSTPPRLLSIMPRLI